MAWPTNSIPTYGRGVWLECNGQSFDRNRFPQLYETLGKTTVPDFRNRFLVSAGGSYSVGSTGGSDSVALSVSQMPSHNHRTSFITASPSILDDDAVSSNNGTISQEIFGTVAQDWVFMNSRGKDPYASSGNHYAYKFSREGEESDLTLMSWTSNSTFSGSGHAHENRPPYIAVKWMIKAK